MQAIGKSKDIELAVEHLIACRDEATVMKEEFEALADKCQAQIDWFRENFLGQNPLVANIKEVMGPPPSLLPKKNGSTSALGSNLHNNVTGRHVSEAILEIFEKHPRTSLFPTDIVDKLETLGEFQGVTRSQVSSQLGYMRIQGTIVQGGDNPRAGSKLRPRKTASSSPKKPTKKKLKKRKKKPSKVLKGTRFRNKKRVTKKGKKTVKKPLRAIGDYQGNVGRLLLTTINKMKKKASGFTSSQVKKIVGNIDDKSFTNAFHHLKTEGYFLLINPDRAGKTGQIFTAAW